MTNNENNSHKVKDIVDTQLLQLKNISDQLHIDNNLNSFNFDNEPYKGVTAIKELSKFKLTNSFFEEIILYYKNDNFLYTTTSSNRLDLFTKNIYSYENWPLEKFTEDLNTIAVPTIRHSEKVDVAIGNAQKELKNIVTFIHPLSYDGKHVNKTVLFLVPEESFKKLITSSVENYDGNTIILDNKNEIITYLEDEEYLSSDSFKQLITSITDDSTSQSIDIGGEEYLFTYVKSKETNWKYITLIPSKNVFSKVASAKMIFSCALLLILFIGCSAIIVVANKNYRPIKLLSQLSQKVLNTNSSDNELDTVKNAIEFLNSQNSQLHFQIHSNEYAIKEYLLFKLLNGNISNIHEFNEKGSAVGLNFTMTLFKVVNIYIKQFNSNPTFDSIKIIKLIESSFSNNTECFVRDNTDLDQFTLILCTNQENVDAVSDVLSHVHTSLRGTLRVPITFGVGNFYTEISDIPKSFIEAMTAVNYRLVKGVDKIIHVSELEDSKSNIDMAVTHTPEKLKIFIKSGNTEQVENLLNNILVYLKQSNISIFAARMICFDIINTVVKTMDEFSKENLLPQKEYPDVLQLSEFETIDELVTIVRNLSEDICKCINEISKKSQMSNIDIMITFIKNNYTDCDFTIQQMAENFNMALPNLSSYFKENTGHNILDYVTTLKIEKAKNLLSNSSIPLKDIGMEVGYYNVTSFIRRFKQVVGETPGEYRKNSTKY